jgi:hypothetical protein
MEKLLPFDFLKTLFQRQTLKYLPPLPSVSHIREIEFPVASILQPNESRLEGLGYAV